MSRRAEVRESPVKNKRRGLFFLNGSECLDSAEEAAIGVLLVHGIGRPGAGGTLFEFGEPLVEWIMKWAGVKDGEVYCQTLKKSGESNGLTPPHALIRLPDASWLLAESHWDECFVPPTFARVCLWGIASAPWTVLSYVAKRLKHLQVPAWFALALALPLSPVVLLLIAIVQLLLGVLLALGSIPIPRIRGYLQSVIERFPAILGDALIFTEKRLGLGAILDQISSDIDWLRKRCNRLVILAHSQGAALSYQTILRWFRSRPHPPPLLFVSFGSGLQTLRGLRPDRGNALGPRRIRYLLLGAYWSVGLFVGGALAESSSPLTVGLIGLGAAVLYTLGPLLLVWHDLARQEETLFREATELSGSGVKWVDFYSDNDPVPNGPLFTSHSSKTQRPRAWPESRPQSPPVELVDVVNGGNIFTDHTRYLANTDEFLTRVIMEIARLPESGMTLDAFTDPVLHETIALRRLRVKVNRWLTRALFTVGIVCAAALERTDVETLGAAITRVPGLGGYSAHLLGIGSLLTAFTIFCLLKNFLWRGWNREEMESTLRTLSTTTGVASSRSIEQIGGIFWFILLFLSFALSVFTMLNYAFPVSPWEFETLWRVPFRASFVSLAIYFALTWRLLSERAGILEQESARRWRPNQPSQRP